MKYPGSELVLNDQGQVYHLGLSPEQISDKIVLVGDQDRVNLVASFFDSVDHSSQHREFNCKTGWYNDKRITALSTGIGTDNIDIVINELDALANINLESREDKNELKSLKMVRIGTCGILQPEIPIHSYILSTYAAGLDNIAHFYDLEETEEEKNLNQLFNDHVKLPDNINTYFAKASESLLNKLNSDKTFNGITVTSSGFYGPQGRQLRLPNKAVGINEKLTSFRHKDHRVVNFEMESSALFALSKGLGHEAATICLGIANRPNLQFSKGYHLEMLSLIQYVLDKI